MFYNKTLIDWIWNFFGKNDFDGNWKYEHIFISYKYLHLEEFMMKTMYLYLSMATRKMIKFRST